MSHTNPLLTPSQVAERLGVSLHQALSWIAKGLLPMAGQSEEGVPLIRDHIVEINGEALISGVPENLRSPRLRRLLADNDQPRVLPCGCTYATATGPGAREALFMCCDAQSLQAAVRLTEALAAAARHDSFFARLAEVSREAFERHLSGRRAERPATRMTSPLSPEVREATTRLEGREPDSAEVVGGVSNRALRGSR